LDLRNLSGDDDAAGAAALAEAFADPLFADLKLSRHEVSEVADGAPGVAEAVLRLYQAYSDRLRAADLLDRDPAERAAAAGFSPSDWVRDFIQAQRNYFPELEEIAETIAAELAGSGL